MAKVYLGLGSNVGAKLEHLKKAETFIQKFIGDVKRKSSYYTTLPWGVTDQDDFVNSVVEVESFQNPHVLLSLINKIEYSMGRLPTRKWGERIIDIDILFYDDICMQTEKLTIPHPLIQERNFVLTPMKEINHMFIHPILQKTIEELYLSSSDKSAVRRIGK